MFGFFFFFSKELSEPAGSNEVSKCVSISSNVRSVEGHQRSSPNECVCIPGLRLCPRDHQIEASWRLCPGTAQDYHHVALHQEASVDFETMRVHDLTILPLRSENRQPSVGCQDDALTVAMGTMLMRA